MTLFFGVGEVIVRIDSNLKFFDSDNPAIISIEMEESSLRENLNGGSFVPSLRQLRVMVVGDSYIHGGGIESSEKFSKKLLNNLKNETTDKETLILDISRPSNNTLDNFNSYKYYVDRFMPDLIIWAYNFNDIQGELGTELEEYIDEGQSPNQVEKEVSFSRSIVEAVYKKSQLILYLSSSVQKELQLNGIVLPVGDFYFLTKSAYQKQNQGWINTQKIFSKVVDNSIKNEVELFVYNMPEFNMLENNDLFDQVDRSLSEFFSNQGEKVHYINGFDDFDQFSDFSKFTLSKYDGHPNSLAHERIANRMTTEIMNLLVK